MNSTANAADRNIQGQAAQVIPFSFEAKQVRTLLINDQPWFVAADVCESLDIANSRRALARLDEDEKGVHSMNTPGGTQNLSTVNQSGLYSLILTSRKAEAKRFKKWITAEVLPAIRKHGRYEDASNKLATLVDDLIGMTEVNALKGVIRDKAKVVPIDRRRSFQVTMHGRLHTRFNVPRVDLIPASQFDAACNFVAAYALEGEWLAKEPEVVGPMLSRADLLNLNALTHYMGRVREIYVRYDMFNALGALGSRAGVELHDYVADGNAVAGSLRSRFKAEIKQAQTQAASTCGRALIGSAAA